MNILRGCFLATWEGQAGGLYQNSVLGSILINIFISVLDKRMFNKCLDIKLKRIIHCVLTSLKSKQILTGWNNDLNLPRPI